MADKIRELTEKVAKELEGYLEDYGVRDLEVCIVEDNFVVKEKEDHWSSYFYCKVNRSSYEVEALEMKKKESLQRINDCAQLVVNTLSVHAKEFDNIFGVKLETIDDFKYSVVQLLDSGIDKRYCIGKVVKRQNSWSNNETFDEYGILFNPACFFSIEFDDEAKKNEEKSHMKFYCEWDRDTIDPEKMGKFLCDIVDVNKDYILRCIEEGKRKED